MLELPQNGESPSRNGFHTVRFGEFEADLRVGEIRKAGSRIKLQDQPFKVLQILLEKRGNVVSREELQSRIWPEDTYGDFDHAVNVAVGKLRTALGDSADILCLLRRYRGVAIVLWQPWKARRCCPPRQNQRLRPIQRMGRDPRTVTSRDACCSCLWQSLLVPRWWRQAYGLDDAA